MEYPGWYDGIESGVRDLVYLLRNDGWNTTCSCGHAMTVQLYISNMDQVEKIATLLLENGIEEFEICARMDNFGGGYWRRWAEITIYEGEGDIEEGTG